MQTLAQPKKLLMLLFLILATQAYSQTTVQLTYYTGNIQDFTVQESGKLFFADENLMIQSGSGDSPTSIPVNLIQKITFPNTTSGMISPNQSSNGIRVYPNPGSDFIRVIALTPGESQIRIYSLTGQLAYQGINPPDNTIDIRHFAAGIYFIQINGETIKLIKK